MKSEIRNSKAERRPRPKIRSRNARVMLRNGFRELGIQISDLGFRILVPMAV